MRNISDAFTFPFKDPNWPVKFFIGGMYVLLSFFAIGIPVLYGYYIQLIQRVRHNEQFPLPEWNDPGVKFILGIKYLSTLFVYYIPLVFISLSIICLVVIDAIRSSNLTDIWGNIVLLAAAVLIIIPYALLMYLLSPIISARFAERESIRDGLGANEVWRHFKQHWQDTLTVVLTSIGVELLAGAGIILFIVGMLFTVFYASIIKFYLYGQIARRMDIAVQQTL